MDRYNSYYFRKKDDRLTISRHFTSIVKCRREYFIFPKLSEKENIKKRYPLEIYLGDESIVQYITIRMEYSLIY